MTVRAIPARVDFRSEIFDSAFAFLEPSGSLYGTTAAIAPALLRR